MSARTGKGRLRIALLAIGVTAIGVGIALTLRPFTSLDALTFFVAVSLIVAGLGVGPEDVVHPGLLGGWWCQSPSPKEDTG